MSSEPMNLQLLPGNLAVCRLEPDGPLPEWAVGGPFFSVTRTPDELSVVCSEGAVPGQTRAERGWRIIRVEGVLDFALTGVLAKLTQPLAKAGISIFAVSTYDTDYLLVRDRDIISAVAALRAEGHRVVRVADS